VIRYEITDLPELRRTFNPKFVDQALDRAMQVATTKTRTRLSRQVRQVYNIKAGDVSRSVVIRKIAQGRVLVYQGRMIGLDKFTARPRKVRTAAGKRIGVTVQVRKDRGRKLVKAAFIAGRGQVIFKRTGEDRLPLERLFGPSIAHMIGQSDVLDIATRQTGEDAAVEFDRYLTYLMEQANR